jgi:hypothetical protein
MATKYDFSHLHYRKKTANNACNPNVYHVVIPWRREVTFEDMGIGRKYPRQDRLNYKGDKPCHTNPSTKREPSLQPARLCTEKEASVWFSQGSDPWYFAQGKTPPGIGGE